LLTTVTNGLYWFSCAAFAGHANPSNTTTTNPIIMTKSDIIESIIATTELEKPTVTFTVEALMGTIKESMVAGQNIYLRGFGTFQLKQRAAKTGRNITKDTTVKIPAHVIPAFKPAKEFVGAIKTKVKAR